MSKTLTRVELSKAVYQVLGISFSESSDIVDALLEEIAQELEQGNAVKLSSFGTFSVRKKKARMGRNPKTKEEIPITARKVVTFHASNLLTERVNQNIRKDAPIM